MATLDRIGWWQRSHAPCRLKRKRILKVREKIKWKKNNKIPKLNSKPANYFKK